MSRQDKKIRKIALKMSKAIEGTLEDSSLWYSVGSGDIFDTERCADIIFPILEEEILSLVKNKK